MEINGQLLVALNIDWLRNEETAGQAGGLGRAQGGGQRISKRRSLPNQNPVHLRPLNQMNNNDPLKFVKKPF
jgi:hypothetical protein